LELFFLWWGTNIVDASLDTGVMISTVNILSCLVLMQVCRNRMGAHTSRMTMHLIRCPRNYWYNLNCSLRCLRFHNLAPLPVLDPIYQGVNQFNPWSRDYELETLCYFERLKKLNSRKNYPAQKYSVIIVENIQKTSTFSLKIKLFYTWGNNLNCI
jgi:hypothetical protein